MTWTLGLLPVLLLLLGAPIFIVFLAAAAATFAFVLPLPPLAMHQALFGGLDAYALLAIPFFILAGELMGVGGIAARLVAWVTSLFGRLPGSLGVATVGANVVMGTISGSSAAAVAAVGGILYPRLIREGYGKPFASGLAASSGSIDIVIPPSIAMILYGVAAEQSITRLFVAGILPGLLIALMMAAFVMLVAVRHDLPTSSFALPAFLAATRRALAALLMPAFVLTGIYAGWFSPTEAGGFACAYAIVVGAFVYRTLGWRELLDAAGRAALLTAQILIIVAAASLFAWLLTVQQVPQALTGWIETLALPPWGFLLAVNILLLLVGCVLDPTSAILVLTPLLLPTVLSLGIDPIHFGVVMTVNLAIGMFTPPFGLNLFVAQSVFDVPLATLYQGVLPFALVQIAALLIITYWSGLSLMLSRPS